MTERADNMQKKLVKCGMRGFLCVLVALFLVTGCARKPSPSEPHEMPPEKPDDFALTKNVILVADNRLGYLYGDPVWLKRGLIDKFVKEAIRPVQQDLYGQDILRWVLELYGSRLPVVHLGGAAHMGCSGEFESFLEIMSAATKPWVMAPGNHDAYMLGNMHCDSGEWAAVCAGADGPMTKDRFVLRYLSFLQENYERFRAANPEEVSLKGQWRETSDSEKFLQSVAWEINKKEPWRSFVVQEVDLRLPDSSLPVTAVVLDTCQYASMPTVVPGPVSRNPERNGQALPNQLNIVGGWLKDDPMGKKVTIFMGHHPFSTLTKDTREALSAMRESYRIPLYVSAHIHSGEYTPRGISKGRQGWLELNIGSILDWPIEFRTFSLQGMRDRPDRLIFRTEPFRIPECWSWAKLMPPKSPVCRGAWEVGPADDAYYRSFMDVSSADPEVIQEKLMESLLHTYAELLKHVPSDGNNKIWPPCCSSDGEIQQEIDRALSEYDLKDKIALLEHLDQFEHTRTPADARLRRDYRLCQAVWSSRHEKLERR